MLNRGYAYTAIINGKDHGRTLLSHLASLYPHSTAQAWQQNLNNREVTVNGITATGNESITSGQTLIWNRPPWIEPDAPQHFEILFDDPHLLAVNKPGGLPTLPGGGFMENTLLRLVQKQTPSANPVHRLGRAIRQLEHTQNSKNLPGAGARHCTARHLQNSHTHRTRTAPAPRFGVGRQPQWQAVTVIGEGDLTVPKQHGVKQHGVKQHFRHHNI
jgi:hypothetical protein